MGKLSFRTRSFQTFPNAQRHHHGAAIFECYYETTKLVMQQQPPHSTTNKTANNNTLNDQKVLDNFSHLSAKENGYGNESKE